ncbi:cytochrome P450 2J5-like [Spea bombifrons]|uniref:cytochrome P450 2J5-like n=1 Tax=Spea bombifrons TaxID=233779 RepID=UPI00234BDF79|nr:cytochrome P450 2J5-like [Spea bombifrons]
MEQYKYHTSDTNCNKDQNIALLYYCPVIYKKMWILQFLLAFLVCLFITKYLKMKWAARSLPPGPSPLPLIGNLWTLSFHLHPLTLSKLANIYGNIYTIWMGQTPVVVLHGYEAVRNALVAHSEELSGRPVTSFLSDITQGKGIVASNGHNWKQQRRFGLMTLRNLGVGKRGLEARIQEQAQCLVELFREKNGKPMDASYMIIHAVANVISAVVFGHCFSFDDKTFQKLVAVNNHLIENIGSSWGRLYDAFPRLMQYVPGPHKKTFENQKYMENFVRKEIRFHQVNGTPEEPDDFIDHYLNQIAKTKDEPDSTFDEDNMIQVAVDLFTAGTETTATTLQWALLFMLAHPDIQVNVRKELDTVLEGSSVINYEDRKRLPYTNAVVHEIQRFANIASVGMIRCNLKEITLVGYTFKKGTMILPNIYSVLHETKHWETPYQFNPYNFLDEDGRFITKEAFLPFAAGHRVCLGEQVARFEIFIFFATLMKAFSFHLPEGVTDVNTKYKSSITLQPHPYKICAVPR